MGCHVRFLTQLQSIVGRVGVLGTQQVAAGRRQGGHRRPVSQTDRGRRVPQLCSHWVRLTWRYDHIRQERYCQMLGLK